MEWLLIVGLAAWVYRISQRTSELERQIKTQLRGETAPEPAPRPSQASAPAQPHVPPVRPANPANAPRPQPQPAPNTIFTAHAPPPLITQPIAPEPLAETVSQTPQPPAAPPQPQPAPAPLGNWRAPTSPPPLAPSPPRDRNVERWLSENGLAWLGGGALALGGIFLVAYAAQRGIFTPLMRLWAAVIVGVLLIGASEWVRRAGRGGALNHPLVAALLAGAGAATLYGSIWGAHGLYNYIAWGSAALALAAVVVLLIGLALLHGEAIGILAIVAGLLAPLLTSKGAWPQDGLSLYVIGVTLTGYALAGFRRWAWVAGASMMGAYAWYAISFSDGETLRGLILLGVAALGACALALSPALRTNETPDDPSWTSALQLLPSLGIVVSSVLVFAHWSLSVSTETPSIMAPAMGAISLVILAAISVRARIAPAFVLAASVAALVFGFLIHWQERFGSIASDFDVWAISAAAAVALSGLGAGLSDKTAMRPVGHGAGAIGAFILLLLTAFSQPFWTDTTAWLTLAVSGVLMYLAAEICARTTTNSARDVAVNIWAIAGSALLLLAIDFLCAPIFKPLAYAAAALALTLLHRWRGWYALSGAAVVAAAVALARAIAPDFTGVAFAGDMSIWLSLNVLLGGALALLAASRVLRRPDIISEAVDCLSTGAIILAVLSAFLVTHRLATGNAHIPLSDFIEFSLYALVLSVAGFCVIPRGVKSMGWLARARGHVMLLFGLIFSLVQLALVLNPWWGISPATIQGPPIFNEMAFAFAAPGLLALLTAGRYYQRDRAVARFYAIFGALFVALWLVLEIRHAFHGAEMSQGPIGLLEGDAYGLAALALGLLESWVVRLRHKRQAGAIGPLTQDLQSASSSISIIALAIAVWMLGICYNPLWAPIEWSTEAPLSAVLAIAAHLIAATAAYGLARLHAPASSPRNASVLAALLFVLTAGFLVIRFLHHGAAMNASESLIGLEGLWYALWPMTFMTFCSWALTRHFVSAVAGSIVHTARQIVAVSIWLALGFMMFGLCILFAPWWGLHPAQATSAGAALLGLGVYLLGGWLAAVSMRLPIAKEYALYVEVAALACVLDLFAATTLIVRRLFRGADMAPALREAGLETWTYSAVWALFSAIVLWTGTAKQSPILRWAGLGLLLATTAKVFLIDMARLDGVIRAASFLGLGGILVLVALAVRKNSQRDTAN